MSAHKGQTRKHSFLEAWANIILGFSINYVANLLILPLFGFRPSLWENFQIGLLYTGVSLVRQYVLRRYFNQLMVKMHIKEREGQ